MSGPTSAGVMSARSLSAVLPPAHAASNRLNHCRSTMTQSWPACISDRRAVPIVASCSAGSGTGGRGEGETFIAASSSAEAIGAGDGALVDGAAERNCSASRPDSSTVPASSSPTEAARLLADGVSARGESDARISGAPSTSSAGPPSIVRLWTRFSDMRHA